MSYDTEVWCSIREYEGLYEISDYGRVRSYYINRANHSKERFSKIPTILSGGVAKNGYKKVTLHKDGCKIVSVWVHRLVLETFGGESPFLKYEAAHLNGDHTDNRYVNLAWVSKEENESHKLLHGTHNRGARCGTSKLTEDIVLLIRKLAKFGHTQKRLSEKFNVRQGHISRIINRKCWVDI